MLGGTLCRAVPAAEIILDELRGWPEVSAAQLRSGTGEGLIAATERLPHLEDMLESIRGLGYGLEAVQRRAT